MKNAFITGVSSGLGHGLCKALLEDGFNVFGVSRREPKDLMENENFHFASLDLADFDVIPNTLGNLLKPGLDLDLVVLNAGVIAPIRDLKDDNVTDMKRVMDINLWSNKVIIDFLFETLSAVKQIVSISSGSAVNCSRGWGAYSLSKAGLNMLTILYAAERPDTHFTSLAPGLIDTGMQDYLSTITMEDKEKYPKLAWLQLAKGTEAMPSSDQVGRLIADTFPTLLLGESGAFVDVRKIELEPPPPSSPPPSPF